MAKRISIYRDNVWAGDGVINEDGEIVECPAVLGWDQDSSWDTYEAIQEAIEAECQLEGTGAVQREDAVYSWTIVDDSPVWTIQMRDNNGVERDTEWPTMPSPEEVRDACEVQWHRLPAYMPEGAYLTVDYSVLDPEVEVLSTGSVEIDVEPDHTHLIGQACGERGCGHYYDTHEWHTPQREVDSQCSRCGLKKTWHWDGKHRGVKYEMPENRNNHKKET